MLSGRREDCIFLGGRRARIRRNKCRGEILDKTVGFARLHQYRRVRPYHVEGPRVVPIV